MYLHNALSRLSSIKQKIYFNIENEVFFKRDDDVPSVQPKIELTYEVIENIEHLERYSKSRNIRYSIPRLRYLVRNGCKVYLPKHNDEVTGYLNVCKLSEFKPYPYNEHTLFDKENAYYIFSCHTFDEYRRNGIYSYMLTQIYSDLIKGKDSVALISITKGNIASGKGIERAGFKKCGDLKYKRFAYIFNSHHFKRENFPKLMLYAYPFEQLYYLLAVSKCCSCIVCAILHSLPVDHLHHLVG